MDTRRYDFEVRVEHRYWQLSGWLSKHGALTPHLLRQLDDWLPPISELLSGPDSVVAIHGDIKSKHVMISDRDGSPEPVGVIDANASGVGHRLWDLGYIWQTICDHDRGLLEVFLLQADLPGRADPDWPKMALTWALLQSWDNARGIPGIEGFDTLDELAQRSFGPVPDVVRG